MHALLRFAVLLVAVGILNSPGSVHGAPRIGSVPYASSVSGAGHSHAPVFGAGGRHLAFVSQANNLVTNDDFGPHLDLFVRDLVASNTVLVSVSTNGFGGANDNIGLYTLSSNGLVIAFDTEAGNLAPGDANRWSDIYVRDLASGTTRLLTLGANGASFNPLISEDGQRVLFESLASNLVTNDFNGTNDFFIHNLTTGVTDLLVTNVAGLTNGGGSSSNVVNGPLVAWDSPEDALVPGDYNRAWDVFVRNVDTGEVQLVSVRHPDFPETTANARSWLDLNSRSLSANGQKLAFITHDGNQTTGDSNRLRDVFVRNFADGTTVNASVFPRGPSFYDYVELAAWPSLSADGRYMAFAGDRPEGTTSSTGWLYWRDLQSSTNRRVAPYSRVNTNFLRPITTLPLVPPAMDNSGRLLAFSSDRDVDVTYRDANNFNDVFLNLMTTHPVPGCSLLPSQTPPLFVSTAWGINQTANGPSQNPAFSPDSQWVFFESRASNLLETALPNQSTTQLYKRGISIVSVSVQDCADGVETLAYSPTRLVSYTTSAATNLGGFSVETPLPGGGINPRFSGDSRYVAFESGTNFIFLHDLQREFAITVTELEGVRYTNSARLTNALVCTGCGNAALDASGRFIAYESRPAPGGITNIFLKDLASGQVEQVSAATNGAGGNGSSFTPQLSHDARFVVFASKASDLVPGDLNRAADIFVRDRWTGATHCLSRNFAGTGTGNRLSSNPILSADGRTVAFQSFASDLVPGDYNNTRDVFIVTLGGPDTDGDGMEDDWEMAYFNTLDRDGSGDFDHDGASDRDEFRAGTNPANDASILRVLRLTTGVAAGPEGARTTVIVWSAVPGKTYRVESKSDWKASWTPVGQDVVASTANASVTHVLEASTVASNAHRFYRVVAVQ